MPPGDGPAESDGVDEGRLLERLRSERNNPDLYQQLGELYASDPAHIDKAVRNFLEAARLLAGHVGPERKEMAERAAAVLQRAAMLASDRDPVLFRLAEAYETAGDHSAAEHVYRDLLSRSGTEGRPFFHLALLERIATLAPHDLEHRRLTASTRERLGMRASAARDLAEMARIEAGSGAPEQALADAEHALRLLPGAADVIQVRAEVADLLGDREGAARAWLEAASAWRLSGDESRARLAAQHAISPSEAQPLGGEAVGGSALLVLTDPMLLAHAESLAQGVGLTALRARSAEIATLPANLKVAVVETATLGDGAAWDMVVHLRATTRPDLPVMVVESDQHLLGEEDHSMLAAAQIPVIGASTPFSAIARLLGEAAALGHDESARRALEPLLPFDDLPQIAPPTVEGPVPAPDGLIADFETRFPQVASFIRALKLDAARREVEVDRLRREAADSARRAAEVTQDRDSSLTAIAEARRDGEEVTARLEAQRRSADRLREETETLRAELNRLLIELRIAHQQVQENTDTRVRCEAELNALMAQSASQRTIEEGLRGELAALTAEAESARRYAQQRAQAERERDGAREESAAARAALARSEETAAEQQRQVHAAEQKLAAERSSRRLAESETQSLREALDGRERELQRAEAAIHAAGLRLTEAEAEADARRRELATRFNASLNTLEAERATLVERERVLEAELSAARAEHVRAISAAGVLAAATSERERQAMTAGFELERSELQAERERERMALEARSEREHAGLVTEFARERTALTATVQQARDESAALRLLNEEQRAVLEQERATQAKLRAEQRAALDVERDVLARLRAEHDQLGHQLNELRGHHLRAEGEARGLRTGMNEAAEQLARANAAAESERQQTVALSLRLEELSRAHVAEQSGRTAAEAMVAHREREAIALRAEFERADTALGESECKLHIANRDTAHLGPELGQAEARIASVQGDLQAARARLLHAEQHSAGVGADRDRLQAELDAERGVLDVLRDALGKKSTEAMRLEGEVRGAREQSERTTGECDRLRAANEALLRRGWLARRFPQSHPGAFALGLLSALGAVALLLAIVRFAGPLRTPESATAQLTVAAPDPGSQPFVAVPTATATQAQAPATPEAAAPGTSTEPIGLADYAAIEQELVRRAEQPGYRVTAKLRTPGEVRAALAYQAGVRGWDDQTLARAVSEALGGSAVAYQFRHRTYVDVLVENLGLDTGFDINAVAAAFTLLRDGKPPLGAVVNTRDEPKVVTSSNDGSSRVQAVTVSLEFAEPTVFPTELQFRPTGAEPSTLRFDGSQSP